MSLALNDWRIQSRDQSAGMSRQGGDLAMYMLDIANVLLGT
jgi:hypothetical protein